MGAASDAILPSQFYCPSDTWATWLLAVSTGSLARSRHDDGLNRKAMIVYSKALASLRIALSNDELTQQNTTIAAILLLSRFEVTAYSKGV
jgi:hypothetical protein